MAKSLTVETARAVKEYIDQGMSYAEISKIDGMPTSKTILRWVRDNRFGVFAEGKGTMPKQVGKPSVYTEEIANEILLRLMENENLKDMLKEPHMPSLGTVMKWRRENYNNFGADYMMAFEARLWYAAEEILSIADDATNDYVEKESKSGKFIAFDAEHVQRSKLRIDSRKWLLSKLVSKFNDKSTIDHTSSDGTMTPNQEPTAFEISFIDGKAPDYDEDDGILN